ncbi:hypothetical protein PMIN06_005917 [Paraphaeosphaeria minitans]
MRFVKRGNNSHRKNCCGPPSTNQPPSWPQWWSLAPSAASRPDVTSCVYQVSTSTRGLSTTTPLYSDAADSAIMSNGFVSGGTIDAPNERDDEWRSAQAELEAKRLEREDRDKQHDGKSLYEVLQANKAAKQDAFEEATRLKNQYRALDDDEAEFLESVLEASRKKEAEVRKDTIEQLDAFRRRREEEERKALEAEASVGVKEEEAHAQWVTHGRKRKKGPELFKGVKQRKTSEPSDDKKDAEKKSKVEKAAPPAHASKADATGATSSKASTAPLSPSQPVLLDLGYASSDDDD